jgi:hypothetical protein
MSDSIIATSEKLDIEFLDAHRVNGLGEFYCSEQGFAISFEHANRDRLAFVAEDRRWIAWNGTHWDTACAETLAEAFFDDLIRALLADAAIEPNAKDRDMRKACFERAHATERARSRTTEADDLSLGFRPQRRGRAQHTERDREPSHGRGHAMRSRATCHKVHGHPLQPGRPTA